MHLRYIHIHCLYGLGCSAQGEQGNLLSEKKYNKYARQGVWFESGKPIYFQWSEEKCLFGTGVAPHSFAKLFAIQPISLEAMA